MKFSFKNAEQTFLDWKMTFKQQKADEYLQFLGSTNPIPKEYYIHKKDDKGEDVVMIDTKKLNFEEYDFMMNKEIKFLSRMLLSAEYLGEGKEDGPEGLEEKETFLSFIYKESDEFKEWAFGYIEGQKKN